MRLSEIEHAHVGGQKSVVLRFLAAPMDANVRGYVGGGKILEWIDKAGYAAAAAWSGHYSVTGYVGNIHLHRVVNVGDMVEVEARVVCGSVGSRSYHGGRGTCGSADAVTSTPGSSWSASSSSTDTRACQSSSAWLRSSRPAEASSPSRASDSCVRRVVRASRAVSSSSSSHADSSHAGRSTPWRRAAGGREEISLPRARSAKK